jgi:hypothetical protein
MARRTIPSFKPKVMDRVLIRPGTRSPYGGQIGIVEAINSQDRYGAILVRFADGLHYRYTLSEVTAVPPPPADTGKPSQQQA